MKYTSEHYDILDDAVGALDTGSMREKYRSGDFPRSDAVKDLDMRYRWDLLWIAADQDRSIYDVIGEYKSSHTDTVLRAIVSTL